MMVVVGGQARKVGKTRAVCDIVSATSEARWTAVKISRHQHGSRTGGDTQRYLDAGAAAAYLIGSGEELPAAGNLIIESNAVPVEADLFVFVTDPELGEWKESATQAVRRADIVVSGHITDEVLRRVREGLGTRAAGRGSQDPTPFI
jgi:hypothetical protein